MAATQARDKSVLSSVDGAVAILQFNRPERLNAVDGEMIADIREALHAAERDPAIRAVMIVGSDRAFMAGADLKLFRDHLDQAPQVAASLIDGFHSMLRAMRAMHTPIVAGVTGSVAGGGLGFALACDLCVMADNAQLLSAYSKIGTNPDAGTTWSLTHLLGRRRALQVMWLNEPINAQEALTLGLVNKVVAPEFLAQETLSLAKRLAAGPRETMGRIKSLVEQACTSDFSAQLDRERAAFVVAAGSDEFREGVTAFFERRPAKF
ncbi:enoyl-CoA hydratase/isomerase family protein [Tardiphaga sp.]|uniref:enoyl-CoA hydratase/isomerase family protein n=1 Tax=Tardiphaga sp. TaxID=1926292 RepID=UPI00352ABDA4